MINGVSQNATLWSQILQEYSSHCDEADPVRIEQIIQRAVEDTDWIMQKVYNV